MAGVGTKQMKNMRGLEVRKELNQNPNLRCITDYYDSNIKLIDLSIMDSTE